MDTKNIELYIRYSANFISFYLANQSLIIPPILYERPNNHNWFIRACLVPIGRRDGNKACQQTN